MFDCCVSDPRFNNFVLLPIGGGCLYAGCQALNKEITLGRLETSEDFQTAKPKVLKTTKIDDLKIEVRPLTKKDTQQRGLPENTTGVIITNIDPDSPINNLQINNIIIEVQKKKIKTPGDLENAVKAALVKKNKSILIVIYNNNNQKSYIGIKLN